MKSLLAVFFFFKSFLSIIIFWVLILVADVESDTAVLAALGYTIFYSLVAIGMDRIVRMDFGLLFFFSIGYILCIFLPQYSVIYLIERFSTFLYLTFFLTVYIPFVFGGEPFTVINAKRVAPPEFWDTKEFKEITSIMALVWCALFLTAFLVTLKQGVVTQIIIPILIILLVGVPFNRYFKNFYFKLKGMA